MPRILGDLPQPHVDPEPYWQLVCDYPFQWREIVNSYFTSYDDAEQLLDGVADQVSCPKNYICDICNKVAFRSIKALEQHKRISHKRTSPLNELVPDTSVCPVCHVNFVQRARLLSHLSDKRIRSKKRGMCCHIEFMRTNPQPLEPKIVNELRTEQASVLRHARKAGHTHAMAVVPAKRKSSCLTSSNVTDAPTRRMKRLRFKQPAAELYY